MHCGRLLPGTLEGIVFHLFDAVDNVGHAVVDSLPHQVERPHPLALVLHLRVNLSVATQADARAEVIHRQEVILPGVVEDLQENGPLHPSHFATNSVIDRREHLPLDGVNGGPLGRFRSSRVACLGLQPRGQGRGEFSEWPDVGPLVKRGHGCLKFGDRLLADPRVYGMAAGRSVSQHTPQLLQIAGRQVRIRKRLIEAASRPGKETFAVEPAGAIGLPSGEVGKPHDHRVHNFPLGVDLARFLLHEFAEVVDFQRADFGGVERGSKPPLGPSAGAADTEVVGQEAGTFRQIDPLNRLAGLLDEIFVHLVTTDPLQVAVAKGCFPASVGKAGECAPVPLALVIFGGQVLFDGFENLSLRLPHRFIDRESLRFFRREATVIRSVEFAAELTGSPLGIGLGTVVFGKERGDVFVNLSIDHLHDQLAAIGAVEDGLAEAVDTLPLFIHHLVVFEEVLTDFKVAFFHLSLSGLDASGHHLALDRLAVLHAQASEHVLHPFTGKDPHQVVFQRQEEAAAPRVALASATAAKLEVDAARFVSLRTDDLQAAHAANFLSFGFHLLPLGDFGNEGIPLGRRHVEPGGVDVLQPGPGHRFGISSQDDVRATAGHVRGDSYRPEPASLRNNLGLAFVVLGIEYLVFHAPLVEQCREMFALLNGNGADEDRQAPSIHFPDFVQGDRLAVPRLLAGVAGG